MSPVISVRVVCYMCAHAHLASIMEVPISLPGGGQTNCRRDTSTVLVLDPRGKEIMGD